MVQDSSKKCTGQCGHNSNPVATLPHAAVVFRLQPFNITSTGRSYELTRQLNRLMPLTDGAADRKTLEL